MLKTCNKQGLKQHYLGTNQVETEKVIKTSQNDNTEREQPQEKIFVGEETEAKDHPQPIAPISYPQRLKKHKLDK